MNVGVCLYYTALRPSWEVLSHIKVLNFCYGLPQSGLPLNQAGHLVGCCLLAVLAEEGGDDEGGAADLPLGDGGGLFLVQGSALLSRPKGPRRMLSSGAGLGVVAYRILQAAGPPVLLTPGTGNIRAHACG